MAFKIKLNEKKRNYIAIALVIMNFIAILVLIGLFIIGIHTYVYLRKSADLLDKNFGVHVFGAVYIIVAIVLVVENLVLCLAINHSRRSRNRQKLIEKRYLKYISAFYALTAIIILAVIIYTIYYINEISSAFKKGLSKKINKYSIDKNNKRILDELQFQYECCGAENLRDWFKTPWVYEDSKKDFNYSDSTPFSCCKRKYLGPCRNQFITSEDTKSLNTQGCGNKFSNELTNILSTAIMLWVVLLGLQILTLILFQYWTISIENALLKGHPKFTSYGWLWGKPTSQKSYYKDQYEDKEERKRLLSPQSYDEQEKYKDRKESKKLLSPKSDYKQNEIEITPETSRIQEIESDFESDRGQYDDNTIRMRQNAFNIESKYTKAEPPKPPSLPVLQRIPAQPQPSPRSKLFMDRKNQISIDFQNESKKCVQCGQEIDNKEVHRCETHDHSVVLLSTISDRIKSNESEKPLSIRKDLRTDTNRSIKETEREVKAKPIQKDNEEGEDTDEDTDKTTEKPRRKYHERYFILKEIR